MLKKLIRNPHAGFTDCAMQGLKVSNTKTIKKFIRELLRQ